MNKKIFIALSVVIVAIVAMGTVSAFDLSDLGSLFGGSPPDQNVTVDGETFHIPGTLKENTSMSKNGTVDDYTYFTSTTYVKSYSNDTDFINILVFDYNGTDAVNFVNYQNGTDKNVNGTQGFYYSDSAAKSFSFTKGSKVITIQSNDEKLIAPVIA
jgi:phage tail tube protein FII